MSAPAPVTLVWLIATACPEDRWKSFPPQSPLQRPFLQDRMSTSKRSRGFTRGRHTHGRRGSFLDHIGPCRLWLVACAAGVACAEELSPRQHASLEVLKFHPWAAALTAVHEAEATQRPKTLLLRRDDNPARSDMWLMFYSADGSPRLDRILSAAILLMFLAFNLWGLQDAHFVFTMLLMKSSSSTGATEDYKRMGPKSEYGSVQPFGPGCEGGDDGKAREQGKWTTSAMFFLTAYRFYTGFLSATWMPYLLAMEGQDLWQEKQSLFMGIAKMLYGATILMNPIFGLLGDQAVQLSHTAGRRVFVRVGVIIAFVGIYVCVTAETEHAFVTFLLGVFLWRLGEALNDITAEALVPEMVPSSQFSVASSIKSSSFLLGGLVGYTMLIALAGVHYGWLYYAYPIGMFMCSIPPLLMLRHDGVRPPSPAVPREVSIEGSIARGRIRSIRLWLDKAYLGPARFRGGFPLASLAVFVFGFGTAPMFFLLLIVRDLVGIQDPVELQEQFSFSSILFFLSAAVTSVLSIMGVHSGGGIGGSARGSPSGGCGRAGGIQLQEKQFQRQQPRSEEMLVLRGTMLVRSMVLFGIVAFLVPGLALFESVTARNVVFHSMAILLGAAFGGAFSRFQDLTWQLLPPNVDVGNAMGFNVMCRLLGVGIGNFLAGLILDHFCLDTSETYEGQRWTTYKGWRVDDSGLKVLPVYSTLGRAPKRRSWPSLR